MQCLNLNRFYYIKEKKEDEIYSEFCGFRSLDKYKESYQQTMSLLTKTFLLCHIVQGMRFLRSNFIIHGDIKTGNVLLGRTLTARLCDFGDSVITSNKGIG
jgi:serine/threonine protein kinase